MSDTIEFMSMSRRSEAIVRVFVPTYRRHALLKRALDSLIAQTFSDWKCEVHNDDPNDSFPGQLVQQLGDARVELHQHKQNLGPVATFNLFYRPTPEPFYSLLEDDNWWEPEFLDTMIREMQSNPDVTMAWCNQRIWEELPDGTWRDTRQCVNSLDSMAARLVDFGGARDIVGPQHANGAMLLRSRYNETYQTPEDWPFFGIEAFRERMIPRPLLYVPQPLAVYAVTLQTARSKRRAEWETVQTILAATFVKHAGDHLSSANLLSDFRARRPPGTNTLLLAAIVEPRCRNLLRHSTLGDWLLLLRGLVRRPNVLWQVVRSRWRHGDWWHLIDRHTSMRFEESKRRRISQLRTEVVHGR
jgi:glycosyltransferase involved in cell wall biosynthesis